MIKTLLKNNRKYMGNCVSSRDNNPNIRKTKIKKPGDDDDLENHWKCPDCEALGKEEINRLTLLKEIIDLVEDDDLTVKQKKKKLDKTIDKHLKGAS